MRQVVSKVAAPAMPLPQKMPRRSRSKRPATRPARAGGVVGGDERHRRAAVERQARRRDHGRGVEFGGGDRHRRNVDAGQLDDVRAHRRAAGEERLVERHRASLPIGLTTPLPLTATGAPAGDQLLTTSPLAFAATASSSRMRELLERDAGLARVEAIFGDADAEAVLDREHELHQRERIEAELVERRPAAAIVAASTWNWSTSTAEMASNVEGSCAGDRESGRRRVHLMSARAARRPTRQNRAPASADCRHVPQTSLELGFADPAAAPLAERLRPKTLDEVIGQRHLLGPGKPLRVAFESGRLHSMILWGPPGVGKTTLARLMADAFDAQFIAMSAVLGGVKDIREAVERAQAARTHGPARPSSSSTRCIASTRASRTPSCRTSSRASSPSSARPPRTRRSRSISALLSRATVHVLKPLDDDDLETLLDRAAGAARGAAARRRGARAPDRLCRRRCAAPAQRLREPGRDGARAAARAPRRQSSDVIDEGMLEHALGEQLRRYDKGGEQFYDTDLGAAQGGARQRSRTRRCTGSSA